MHIPISVERATAARRYVVILVAGLLAVGILATLMQPLFVSLRLDDFANTFYPAANYLLRGENVYVNAYPRPNNDRQYPPYDPIWILYSVVPFGTWPLPMAEAFRFVLDLALLPFLAYLAARWARLRNAWLAGLLVLAPWHLTELSTGQWTGLVFLGVFLCYWASARASPLMMATGLLFLLTKPNIVALIILAALVLAWRTRILFKTVLLLAIFAVVSSLAQPTWPFELLTLYVDRLAHPRLADSILLLPGYPWSQLVLLALGAFYLVWDLRRSKGEPPSPRLWALLLCASLVGALHTFVYDWQLLMLPLALLLRQRGGVILTVGLYVYALAWVILSLGLGIRFPSPTIIPALVLIILIVRELVLHPRPTQQVLPA